jgi:hypothetical protein
LFQYTVLLSKYLEVNLNSHYEGKHQNHLHDSIKLTPSSHKVLKKKMTCSSPSEQTASAPLETQLRFVLCERGARKWSAGASYWLKPHLICYYVAFYFLQEERTFLLI